MRIIKIVPDTVVDGPGLRTSIYFAGCKVHCEGCHNLESWNLSGGEEMYPTEVLCKIKEYGNKRVTLTGGNPLDQEHLFHIQTLCESLKKEGYDIWLYTGYTWEHVIREIQDFMWRPGSRRIELVKILDNIDVLVDGPFMLSKKDSSLLYRGSSNQRLIDVQKSLRSNKVIIYKDDGNAPADSRTD